MKGRGRPGRGGGGESPANHPEQKVILILILPIRLQIQRPSQLTSEMYSCTPFREGEWVCLLF